MNCFLFCYFVVVDKGVVVSEGGGVGEVTFTQWVKISQRNDLFCTAHSSLLKPAAYISHNAPREVKRAEACGRKYLVLFYK